MKLFMATLYFQEELSLEDIEEIIEGLININCTSIEVQEVD